MTTSNQSLALKGSPFTLPPALLPLGEIAYDFAWSWTPRAAALFARLDTPLWEATDHNPVKVLAGVSRDRLAAAADDPTFLEQVREAHAAIASERAGPAWFAGVQRTLATSPRPFQVAYFCLEYGLSECFQIYSGGLGLLAGDHLKSAAQLGIPLVAIGLLYRNGYFHQALDTNGVQQEHFPPLDPTHQPIRRVMDPATDNARQVMVAIQLPGRQVHAAVWRVDVGGVRLYLLDTNLPDNSAADREITANLYLGDQVRRIEQEIVLGIGGVRVLAAVGEQPTVFHMNEGHAAFMALERIRQIRAQYRVSFDQAREAAACSHLFTTHTPVPAGIDRFPPALVEHYFQEQVEPLGLDMEGFLALGREDVSDKVEAFSMAVLAIRTSKHCNGVSRLHGEVSRRMWREIWPYTPEHEVPIGHVTNGVHTASWVGPHMAGLYDKHLSGAWRSAPQEPSSWAGVASIPDAALWEARQGARRVLIDWVRARSALGKTGGIVPELDPEALIIGFARRFAGYKRATLLLRDPARLERLLAGGAGGKRPLQLLISGKSHPGDGWGKDLIRNVVEFARSPRSLGRVVFLEDYSIETARHLVRGCDVWLNTPIRGLEASGTSGMKAALNGVLNASILDGWWDEAYAGDLGFEIAARGTYPSDAPDSERDDFESRALYKLLEGRLAEDFWSRNSVGVPERWTAMMKRCIAALGPGFSTHRMLIDYAQQYYLPAHAWAARLMTDQGGDLREAREAADKIERYRKLWKEIRFKGVECSGEPGGTGFRLAAIVRLGALRPDELLVQAYHGVVERAGESNEPLISTEVPPLPIPHGKAVRLKHAQALGDGVHSYQGRFEADEGAAAALAGGRYGVCIRTLPGDERLVTPFIPGLIAHGPVHAVEADRGAHV